MSSTITDESNQLHNSLSLLKELINAVASDNLTEVGLSQFWTVFRFIPKENDPRNRKVPEFLVDCLSNIAIEKLNSEATDWVPLASTICILFNNIPDLSYGGSMPKLLSKVLFENYRSESISLLYFINQGFEKSRFSKNNITEDLIPWNYVISFTLEFYLNHPKSLISTDNILYVMVATLFNKVRKDGFNIFLLKFLRVALSNYNNLDFSPEKNSYLKLLYSLSDSEVVELLTEKTQSKIGIFKSILSFIDQMIDKPTSDFWLYKKAFFLSWKELELNKLPSLKASCIESADDNDELFDLFEFYTPNDITSNLKNHHRKKIISIIFDYYLNHPQFKTTDKKSNAVYPHKLFDSILEHIYLLLKASSLLENSKQETSQLKWYIDMILIGIQKKSFKYALLNEITSKIKNYLLNNMSLKINLLFRTSWLLHVEPSFQISDSETSIGEVYGLWLKKLLQSISHKGDSNPKIYKNLITSFTSLLDKDPIQMSTEHLKLVLSTVSFTLPEFDGFKIKSKKKIKDSLGDIPNKQTVLKNLLTSKTEEKMITVLEAIKLFHNSKKKELPPRLISASMFHSSWFQSNFIPQLLNSKDPTIEDYSQSRYELIALLHSTGKIPISLFEKFKDKSTNSNKKKTISNHETNDNLKDSLLASIIELQELLEDFTELILSSSTSQTYMNQAMQYQISLEKTTQTIKSKLSSFNQNQKEGKRFLSLRDLEIDPSGHYLSAKTKYKGFCCGSIETNDGEIKNDDHYSYGIQTVECFLKFLVIITVNKTDSTTLKSIFKRVAVLLIQDDILGLSTYVCLNHWINQLSISNDPSKFLGTKHHKLVNRNFASILGIALAELEILSYEPSSNAHMFKLPKLSTSYKPTEKNIVCPLLSIMKSNGPRMTLPSFIIHELSCYRFPLIKSSPAITNMLATFLYYRKMDSLQENAPSFLSTVLPIISYLVKNSSLAFQDETIDILKDMGNNPYFPFLAWVHLERERPYLVYKSEPNSVTDDSEFLFSHLKLYYLNPITNDQEELSEEELLNSLQNRVIKALRFLNEPINKTDHQDCNLNHCSNLPKDITSELPCPFYCPSNTSPVPNRNGLQKLLQLLKTS